MSVVVSKMKSMACRMAGLRVVAIPDIIMRQLEVSPSLHISDSTSCVLNCSSLVSPHQVELCARPWRGSITVDHESLASLRDVIKSCSYTAITTLGNSREFRPEIQLLKLNSLYYSQFPTPGLHVQHKCNYRYAPTFPCMKPKEVRGSASAPLLRRA